MIWTFFAALKGAAKAGNDLLVIQQITLYSVFYIITNVEVEMLHLCAKHMHRIFNLEAVSIDAVNVLRYH
jgi:hypothetical protein